MTHADAKPATQQPACTAQSDAINRDIIRATQAGLPLVAAPYDAIAAELGIAPEEVIERLSRMLDAGIVRRIGIVPNHYALGLTLNAMTVWDIDDAVIDRLGTAVGALDFVTHCYARPRRLPHWPYNLFAMVHGATQPEIDRKIAEVAALLGAACRGRDVLVSTRILKKTGLRLAA